MKKIIKLSLLSLGIVFSAILMNNQMIPYVEASTDLDPDPPSPPADGSEYWDFDVGDNIGWRFSIDIGEEQPDFDLIFNVSDIRLSSSTTYNVILRELYFNTTENKLMDNKSKSNLQSTQIDYQNGWAQPGNVMSSILPYPSGVSFEFNFFLPNHNPTSIDLNYYANELYNHYYYNFFYFTPTITATSNPDNNVILMEDGFTTIEQVYYDNGTLKEGILDIGIMGYYARISRIFDFNPLDDLEWGVNESSVVYAGYDTNMTKIVIKGFENDTSNQFIDFLTIAYQKVIADLYYWNGTDWEQYKNDFPVAFANELYPILNFSEVSPIGFPKNTIGSEIEILVRAYFDFSNEIQLDYGDNWLEATNISSDGTFYFEWSTNGVANYLVINNFWPFEDVVIHYSFNYSINELIDHYEFEFVPFGEADFEVALNISVSKETLVLISSYIHNPCNWSLCNGLLFVDLFMEDITALIEINVTIKYDNNKYENITLWWFNISGNNGKGCWEKISFTYVGSGKLVFYSDHFSVYALSGTLKVPPELNYNWNPNPHVNLKPLDIPEPPPPNIEPPPPDYTLLIVLISIALGLVATAGIYYYYKKKILKTE